MKTLVSESYRKKRRTDVKEKEHTHTHTQKKNVVPSLVYTHANVLTPVLRCPVFQGVPPGD